MTPRFFRSGSDFRLWLEANHDRMKEIWIGFYKKDSGRQGITYREALDEALCFGWIDGVRKSLDARRYVNRFTPRTPKSAWSSVNIRRVGELKRLGLMAAPGLAALERRDRKKAPYSFEHRQTTLDPSLQKRFEADTRGWEFFGAQPPGYRRTILWWIMSAVKDETRLRRLDTLIDHCRRGRRIDFMAPATRR
jgi:uncharacterized protein YdeI (YjbR/CyaY-like superfamily)